MNINILPVDGELHVDIDAMWIHDMIQLSAKEKFRQCEKWDSQSQLCRMGVYCQSVEGHTCTQNITAG